MQLWFGSFQECKFLIHRFIRVISESAFYLFVNNRQPPRPPSVIFHPIAIEYYLNLHDELQVLSDTLPLRPMFPSGCSSLAWVSALFQLYRSRLLSASSRTTASGFPWRSGWSLGRRHPSRRRGRLIPYQSTLGPELLSTRQLLWRACPSP